MAEVAISIVAVAIATASLIFGMLAHQSTERAKRIDELLGEKETVGFGASRLRHEGFPRKKSDRKLVIRAVLNGCLFEGSDRARGMLLAAIDRHREDCGSDLTEALDAVEASYRHVKGFGLTDKELNLVNADLRLGAVRKVLLGELDAALNRPGARPVPTSPV